MSTCDSQATLVKPDRNVTDEPLAEIMMAINKFDPSWVARLDLGGLSSCRQEVFYTGCLPEWIQNLHNLEILRASKLGVVILEPWLLTLPYLHTLDLEQNQISTWPHFLAESRTLQTVVLDGNPCLERAFQKSPTLRSLYFSWNATSASTKSLPQSIRGPEWHVASVARSSSSVSVNHLGFFCGGIYTLSTPPDLSNDGFLTPVEPCRLVERQSKPMHELISTESPDDTIQRKMSLYQGEGRKQSQITLQVADDIACLVNRYRLQKTEDRQSFVLLMGLPSDNYNKLLKGSMKRLNLEGMYKFLVMLHGEEEEYIANLKTVEREFYYNGKVKSAYFSCCLRDIFSGFPAMRLIHEKAINPALKRFCSAIESSLVRKSNPHYIPNITVGQAIVELCTSFRKLQLAVQKYAENIWVTEHHLDLANSPTKLYRDKEFKSYVEKQITRLGGLGGHSPFGGSSPGTEAKSGFPDSNGDFSDFGDSGELDMSKHKLTDWLHKHPQKSEKLFTHSMADFVYLPLIRLVRYERFFTSLVGTDPVYQSVLKVLRKLRKLCSTNIQQSREMARRKVLSKKFRRGLASFENYQWDAVFTVHSRGYLEPGILSRNTNDVLDVDGQPASFVKEFFSESRLRILRMVDCGTDVQIWDEVFEHLVGITKKSNIVALPGKDCPGKDRLRIVFLDVRETCLITVQDFNALYFTPNHPNQELLEALCLVGNKKIL